MCEVHKTREELIKTRIIGGEDYQMDDGNWTRRYETLDGIRPHLIEGEYVIHELDRIKGTRTTIVDKNTGEIIRETR